MINKINFEKNYIEVVDYIKSVTFRAPMKKFIDNNCEHFENKEENSHFNKQLHDEFKTLVENLLIAIKEDLSINDNDFLKIAKVGLEHSIDKPYFEQILNVDNYEWFKTVMVKRNLLLKEEAKKLMYVNMGDMSYTRDSTINKMLRDKEQMELELALAMTAEEEKKKLYSEEDNIEVINYLNVIK